MWESAFGDFQGEWEGLENMILVFQAFHFPSFAQARQSSCFFFRSMVRRKR
jgi:hypothetical protein